MRLNKLSVKTSYASLAFVIGLQPLALNAQLEEIIVTAQKRSESLQDSPVAVTAYNKEALEALGIESLDGLRLSSPSIQGYYFPTSSNTVSLFIRGLGNLDAQTLTTDNPVGIYIDDVYIARSTGALIELLDIERIEVLRGPQGTLYGRNSSAGAVKFISRKPADQAKVQINGSVGNFNHYKLGVTVDLPLADNLYTKVSVMGSNVDGWVENSGPNPVVNQPTEDFNARQQLATRVAIHWVASDTINVDYNYDYSDINSTPPYFQAPANSASRSQQTELFVDGNSFQYVLPESSMYQQGHNLTASLQLSDSLELKSITSYREFQDSAVQNWSDTLFFATDLTYATNAFSQEFQLQGSTENFEYVAGLYYFTETGDKMESQFVNFDGGADFTPGTADDIGPIATDALLSPLADLPFVPAAFGGPVGTAIGFTSFDTELTSTAVFGQVSYAINDRLNTTLGLRYTNDERDASRSGTNASFEEGANTDSFSSTDFTFILEYVINDSVNSYAKVSSGYRSGGSSERAPNFAQTFQPEEVTSYELGIKSELMDNRVRINAALFQTTTDNAINTIGGVGPQAALQETFNFGSVDISGLELEILAALTDSSTLGLNYTLLNSDLSNVIVPAESQLRTSGDDITTMTFVPQAPDNALSITFDQELSLGGLDWVIHFDYSYRDEVFSSAIFTPVDSLGVLNGRLSLRDFQLGNTDLGLEFWMRNITDDETIIYDLAQAGNQFNSPRTYGLDIKIKF